MGNKSMVKDVVQKIRDVALSLIKNTSILFILLLSVWWTGWSGVSHARLIVTPTRVVFEGRTHSQEIILIHVGDREATYRISFLHYRMKVDGSLEEIKEPKPDEQITFAAKFIRYSPRQVTLKPGEKQTVRLMVRKPKDLSFGEYRSHLLFKEQAPPDLGADIEKGLKGADDKSVGAKLISLSAVSIPVVVRHGDISVKVEIQEARIIEREVALVEAESKETGEGKPGNKKDVDKLSLKLKRSGNASVSGDVAVTFIPSGSSREYEVSRANGITVYYPNVYRDLFIPLKAPEGTFLKNGKLHITFCKRQSEGGTILAENNLIVP